MVSCVSSFLIQSSFTLCSNVVTLRDLILIRFSHKVVDRNFTRILFHFLASVLAVSSRTWKFQSRVQIADRYAPWKFFVGAEYFVL
jgi:hypothetical protein